MIKLNTNERKRLKFNIEVSGVQPSDLRGSMKIISEGVEYGFPIGIDNGKVVVEIKPLSEISGQDFKDGQTLPTRLEIIANETFLIPWTDTIKIENPIKVEAKIVDNIEEDISETIIPKIKIGNIEEEMIEKPKKKLVEKKVEKKVEKPKKKEPKTRFGKLLEN
jgi:hypothetical protein